MDLCPVCGAYWLGCGHWDGPDVPLSSPNYVDTTVTWFGETVSGFDLRIEPAGDLYFSETHYSFNGDIT